MRLSVISLALACVLSAATSAAQQTPNPPPKMAASSFALAEVHVDQRKIGGRWYAEDASLTAPARIAIEYGQPHARGRKIEGGLIPLDTVWRLGANTATTLHTDLDFTLGTLNIPHGDYSLYVLYTRGGWQLIVNRVTGGWGSDYDASKDLGRIPLTAKTRGDKEESLTIYLVPESAQPRSGYAALKGTLRVVWGTTELSTGWTIGL